MYNAMNTCSFNNNNFRTGDTLDSRSIHLFNEQLRGTFFHTLLAKMSLRKLPKSMLMLSDFYDAYSVSNRHYAGTHTIDISTIHGTVSRNGDFDYDFAPLRKSDESRWCRVATAMLCGLNLPAIDLIQVGEHYFVKDGHHRISVARALGIMYLDATIEVWK